jgi:23S rRNA (pseudouridine1915-N3)-methyltransferase
MIKIICVGKIKEKYLKELIADYQTRINKYHKLEIIEVKDEENLEKEKNNILKVMDAKDYIITLEIEGKSYSSEEFSQHLDNLFLKTNNITFIIGSSLGIPNEIKKLKKESITFSKFTFPHGLFRGILLEQIYRAFKILNHETYHK